jgi:hypothetical protein
MSGSASGKVILIADPGFHSASRLTIFVSPLFPLPEGAGERRLRLRNPESSWDT